MADLSLWNVILYTLDHIVHASTVFLISLYEIHNMVMSSAYAVINIPNRSIF